MNRSAKYISTLALSLLFALPFAAHAAVCSGEVLQSPSDDWQGSISCHDGSGTIKLVDGIYTATDILKVKSPKTRVESQNMGGATIVGGWEILSGQGLSLDKLNLKPPSGKRLMLMENGWVQIRDCYVDASSFTASILVQTVGGVFRLDSRYRVSTWDIGAGITGDVFDFDEGTAIKIVGNVNPPNDVRINVDQNQNATLSANVFALDQSNLMAAGLRMYAKGTPQTNKIRAIDARRGSHVTFQDSNNRIQGFDIGITVRQNSHASLQGITLRDAGYAALYVDGAGKISWDTGTTVLAGNVANTRSAPWGGNLEAP